VTFDEVLEQALEMLRRRGRVSYRALKVQFQLDDTLLEILKDEIVEVHELARDQEGKMLVWTGDTASPFVPASSPVPDQGRAPLTYTPPYLAEKILTSRSAVEGERKQVTVLFADIKDSTELIRDLDPEAAQQLLDPALRACYAALTMQTAMREHTEAVRHAHGIEMRIRVGLNSGEVVVRAIGNDLHMDYSAVGQTTHLAARMEQLAMPGTIRLTAATLRLVEGLVRVHALGPISVKGMTEPVEVFELVGAGALRRRLWLLDVLPDDSPFRMLEPPQRRQRTLEALKRVLLRESRVQPLLLVCEDLHWIDAETQALLDSLSESLPTARLLLLVNYRPEYQYGWGSKTYYTQCDSIRCRQRVPGLPSMPCWLRPMRQQARPRRGWASSPRHWRWWTIPASGTGKQRSTGSRAISCCGSPSRTRPRRKRASSRPSPWPAASRPNPGSCGRR
jgi:class 3 adenylate cyclase